MFRAVLEKSFLLQGPLCGEKCVHLAFGTFFWIRFTAPDLKPVHAAAPSGQIPAQSFHEIEYSEKKLLRH